LTNKTQNDSSLRDNSNTAVDCHRERQGKTCSLNEWTADMPLKYLIMSNNP